VVGNKGRRRSKPPACHPACEANYTVPIIYGLPSHETFEAVERGEIPWVAIGGCVVEPDNPRWACPACEHPW
jgi:hypothetical protein